jgi:superfamily II DNA helicase RecQ
MGVSILTVSFNPETETFDDRPLKRFAVGKSIVSLSSHLFAVKEKTYATLIVHYRTMMQLVDELHDVSIPSDPWQASTEPPPQPAKATSTPTPDRPPSNGKSQAKAKRPAYEPTDLTPAQMKLFDKMRRWRYERATGMTIPAYQVCSNRELEQVVRQIPKTLSELEQIDGFKHAKVAAHGAKLLEALHQFTGRQ